MKKPPKHDPMPPESSFSRQVGAKAKRKRNAQRHRANSIWLGLGQMGIVGWSIVVPTLGGTALGVWLDRRHPQVHSWTLMFLVAGLCLGCVNAWLWVSKEEESIDDEDRHANDA